VRKRFGSWKRAPAPSVPTYAALRQSLLGRALPPTFHPRTRASQPTQPLLAVASQPLPPALQPHTMFMHYRSDFLGAVTLTLGPALAPDSEARWTTSAIPTLENALSLLEHKLRPVCHHWRLALQVDTLPHPLDTSDGHCEPVIARLASASPATIVAMCQAFASVVAPLGTAPARRIKAARNWHSCLTWAQLVARGALPQRLAAAGKRIAGDSPRPNERGTAGPKPSASSGHTLRRRQSPARW
jgi:hypothetical protein